jgi:hypothetical protein
MKKTVFFFSILMMSASLTFAYSGPPAHSVPPQTIDIAVILGSRPPAPNEANLMRAEEAKHPNIAKAMHDIEKSMKALHDAPDDFGGHKAQAESDLKQAWVSLRKALYFRLYRDTH